MLNFVRVLDKASFTLRTIRSSIKTLCELMHILFGLSNLTLLKLQICCCVLQARPFIRRAVLLPLTVVVVDYAAIRRSPVTV